MKKRRTHGLSLLERAIIVRTWDTEKTRAQIHALMGDDSNQFVNASGRVMFVVLGACIDEQVDEEMLELRILRSSVNALIEQQGESVITPQRRASLRSGLAACERLIGALPRAALVASACDLNIKMRTGHIMATDFQQRVAQAGA